MLSDEEKKAIELLEDRIICGNKEGVSYRNLRIISRIIEKQSKEIEHQIEKRANQKKELAILNAKQVEFNKLVNTVNSYKGQFKRQEKEIEEYKKQLDLDNECEIALNSKVMDLEKEIEELKEKNEYLPSWVNRKYISKDKIKAKIEEVEQWELYNMKIPRLSTLDERLGAKIGIKYVLQSLLEKE